MCYAPPWRALFRHLNSFKCSEADVLCTVWLGNVLRATMACNFSPLIRPDGSAPAALASLLFDPPEPQIIEKTQLIAPFLPFRAPASSSSDSSSSLIFSLLLFSSLTLPASAFPSVHIVVSLTSKLPSVVTGYRNCAHYSEVHLTEGGVGWTLWCEISDPPFDLPLMSHYTSAYPLYPQQCHQQVERIQLWFYNPKLFCSG